MGPRSDCVFTLETLRQSLTCAILSSHARESYFGDLKQFESAAHIAGIVEDLQRKNGLCDSHLRIMDYLH